MSDTNIDTRINRIVYGVAAWQKLPYAPQKVAVTDVATPGEAKSQIKQLITEARIDELQRVIEQDGNVFVGNGENQIIWNARNRLAALQGRE